MRNTLWFAGATALALVFMVSVGDGYATEAPTMQSLDPMTVITPIDMPTAGCSSCYSIRDSDQKNMCLAKCKGQSSYCYSIRDSDQKNYCLAVVKGQRSYCYSIRRSDLKNTCLAEVR